MHEVPEKTNVDNRLFDADIIHTPPSRDTVVIPSGDDILYSNFTYNPAAYYFLYIGDLKTYSLNHFVREALEHRFNHRNIQFIAIVPDVCVQYNYTNIIVINPTASKAQIENQRFSGHHEKPRLSSRISSAEFMTAVSLSQPVLDLIDLILQHQNQLYINLYESVLEMTLDRIPRVSVLGPDKYIANRYNNKVIQRKELEGIVPLIDGFCCTSLDEVVEKTDKLEDCWKEGVFISAAFSAAGANSAIVKSKEEIFQHFFVNNCDYIVTRYLPHKYDPTVLAVVANENDVYIAGIADQVIIDGNKFIGSTFPTQISPEHQALLKEYTTRIGRHIGKAGYRGIFGCDFLISEEGEIYFLEINARKQGTTLEFCFTLEQNLPEGTPSLPELEYFAVTESRFPPQCVEMVENIRNIHWGTYNYKIRSPIITSGYIPQNPYERETFTKIARRELVKDFVILEHLGSNLMVTPGTFLARVVSVATSREEVDEGICQGVGFIEQTFNKA